MRFVTILVLAVAMLTVAVVIESAASKLRHTEQNTSSSTDTKPQQRLRLKVVTNQLASENGVIPVELECKDAELSALNSLEGLPCVLRNRTTKPISAGVTFTSVLLEKDGVTFVTSDYTMFDTFLHPDLRNERKSSLFLPGQEYPQNKLPVEYDSNVVIKGITVGIDYIEFDDETSLGSNQAGQRIISDTRLGAAKYKNWLVQRYDQAGQSLAAVIPLLDADEALSELGFQTGPELSGARMYRNLARRTYKTKGAEGLLKQLKNTKSSFHKQE